MKMNNKAKRHTIKQVVETIRRHKRFMVSAHINPDPDALGSGLALASLLKRLGKQVIVATDGGMPKAFTYFPQPVRVVDHLPKNSNIEVAFTTDVPILSRTGNMEPVIASIPVVVNIDHHISNHLFGTVNWLDVGAAATGEMVYRLYQAFGKKPTRAEAFCLYMAIVTDTGSFRYRNTTPVIHQIAGELIAAGVDPLYVSQKLYEKHSVSDLKFLGHVLAEMRYTPDRKIAWLELPAPLLKRWKPGPEIRDELVNYPRSVESVEAAFVLRQESSDGKVRVSFRSKGRVDVNAIAHQFGGGGHSAASGCTVKGKLPAVRARVLAAVRQAVKKLK
jgi:phosphoesterase RecJ-like protein